MQLRGFDFKVIELGPGVEWFVIGRWGFRRRETGEMARGNAGNSAVVVDRSMRRPAAHYLGNVGECAVNEVDSGGLWREGIAVVLVPCRGEERTILVRLSVDIVVVVMAVDNVGRWGRRGNPGRDFS